MAFTDIIYNKVDGVARITINRPEVYNALRGKTTDEMVVALHDARDDDSIRVVVIAGSGPNAFCSGRDQAEDRSSPEYSGASEEDFMNIIRRLPKPVIAEVDGFRHWFRQHTGVHVRFHSGVGTLHIRADRAACGQSGCGIWRRLPRQRGRAKEGAGNLDAYSAVFGQKGL